MFIFTGDVIRGATDLAGALLADTLLADTF